MSTHLHKLDIWKMAALMLGESELKENSKTYRLMEVFYETVRDDELRQNCWRFATKSAELPALEEAPQGPYARQYQLPNTCVFLIPLTEHGDPRGKTVPYTLQGDKILTDAPAPLPVRYISNNISEGAFDASFTKLLSISLALTLAHNITGKTSYVDRLSAQYEQAMSRAESANALEAPFIYEEPLDIISVR